MIPLVPPFITDQVAQGQRAGTLSAWTLFLDISGFTAMTEALMAHGKDGAEALSRIINAVFGPLLDDVARAGAFVTTFAGDAFTVVLPAGPQEGGGAVRLALDLMASFEREPLHRTPWGEFILSAKIGVGQGEVRWGVLEHHGHLGYYFRGPAIDEAAAGEHAVKPGWVALPARWGDEVPPAVQREAASDPAWSLLKGPDAGPRPPAEALTAPAVDPALLGRFWPLDRLPKPGPGEFRNLVSLFVTFDETASDLDTVFAQLTEAAEQNGASFNLLDFGDKGGVALLLFGAPLFLERPLDRGLAAAWQLHGRLPALRLGLAAGQAYAGYVGSDLRATYTALGRVVNLSARLATSAQPGEVLVVAEDLGAQRGFRGESLGPRPFKGIARPVEVTRMTGSSAAGPELGLEEGLGRQAELTLLRQAYRAAFTGRQPVIFGVFGEAGTGKTQLAADLVRSGFDDAEVVVLGADPVFPQSFQPFLSDLQTRFGGAEVTAVLDDLARPDRPELLGAELRRGRAPLLALLGQTEPRDPFAELDPQARFDRTVEALAAYWSLRSLARPTLIVVERAEALDEATAAVLARLNSSAEALPLGILLLVRGAAAESLAGVPLRPLSLGPFSDDEAAALVRRLCAGEPEAGLIAFLRQRTDNVPLYLTALIRLLSERGFLTVADGRVRLGEVPLEALPRSLEDLLLSQLESLPRELKEALPPLSVLGHSFPAEVAGGLLGGAGAGLLASLQDAQILRREGDGHWTFQKDVIREAVYRLQLGETLKSLHGQAADAWAQAYPEAARHAREKAFHAHRAERLDQAREAYALAAAAAQAEFLNEEALQLFDQFLALSRDPGRNAEARYAKALVQELRGRWADTVAEIERGLGLAVLAGESSLFSRFFALLGQIRLKQSDLAAARDCFVKAITDPRNTQASPELIQARLDLGRVHMLDARYGEALNRFYEARDLARENGFQREEGQAQYLLGGLFFTRNRRKEALALYRESLALFRALGQQRLVANPLYDLSRMNQAEGRIDDARKQMTEVLDIYTSIGYSSGLAAALLNLGLIEEQTGNFSAARDYLHQSKTLAADLGEDLAVAYAEFCLGANAYKAGELNQALSYLTEAHRRIQALGVGSYLGYALSYLVAVLVRLGRVDEAVERAVELSKAMASHGVDVEHGRAALALAELLETPQNLSPAVRKGLVQVGRDLGLRRVSALAFYAKALAEAREAGYLNTLIPTLHHFGDFLRRRGRGASGDRLLRACAQYSRKAGFALMLSRLSESYPDLFPAVQAP